MTIINHSKTTRVVPVSPNTGASSDISTVMQSGIWGGRRCFILGGGPSMSGLNLSKLNGELVVGINKAFVHGQVVVNYSMDHNFYESLVHPGKDQRNIQLSNMWRAFGGIKLFLKREKDVYNGVYTVNRIERKVMSHDPSIGIYGGTNSGLGAMMFAISLGCKHIGLIGYDMKIDRTGDRTHWHEGYPHSKVTPRKEVLDSEERKLDKFMKEFEEFAPTIKADGIRVANLNPNSGLNCFDKMTMDAFVGVQIVK
jgi:hypothetical protein